MGEYAGSWSDWTVTSYGEWTRGTTVDTGSPYNVGSPTISYDYSNLKVGNSNPTAVYYLNSSNPIYRLRDSAGNDFIHKYSYQNRDIDTTTPTSRTRNLKRTRNIYNSGSVSLSCTFATTVYFAYGNGTTAWVIQQTANYNNNSYVVSADMGMKINIYLNTIFVNSVNISPSAPYATGVIPGAVTWTVASSFYNVTWKGYYGDRSKSSSGALNNPADGNFVNNGNIPNVKLTSVSNSDSWDEYVRTESQTTTDVEAGSPIGGSRYYDTVTTKIY